MAYKLGTIGGLFDGPLPGLTIDPSWLPPGTQVGPSGKLEPRPAPASPPSSPDLPVVPFLVGAAVGAAIVFLLKR